ncbi:MAG: MotE family protein [Roseinatronobacter sp.]
MTHAPAPYHTKIAIGALPILAFLLFFAGASRLGLGVASVVAAENTVSDVKAISDTPDRLLEALKEREERLRQAEADLARRRNDVAAAEDAIRAQLQALEAAEAQLLGTLNLTATAAETDVARLVTIYENMKPKQAAELFATMDVGFAAGFFARLRPDLAGMILAELDPLQAYAISAVLAGRHALTPKE